MIRSSLLCAAAVLGCAKPVSRPPSNAARSVRADPAAKPLDLVAIDAPASAGRFGLEIVIEAQGPLFAVHWNGLSEETQPPISIDSTPTQTIDVLRKEFADPYTETMPVTLILDRRVPWSYVAEITKLAQATKHPQANFVFVTKNAQKTWITIDLGPGGTQLAIPGDTPWIDAHQRIVAAARAGKPVELHEDELR